MTESGVNRRPSAFSQPIILIETMLQVFMKDEDSFAMIATISVIPTAQYTPRKNSGFIGSTWSALCTWRGRIFIHLNAET
jgi:hypothetical protein